MDVKGKVLLRTLPQTPRSQGGCKKSIPQFWTPILPGVNCGTPCWIYLLDPPSGLGQYPGHPQCRSRPAVRAKSGVRPSEVLVKGRSSVFSSRPSYPKAPK